MNNRRIFGIEPVEGTGRIRTDPDSKSHWAEIHEFALGVESILYQLCLHFSTGISSRLPLAERIAFLRHLQDEKLPVNLLQNRRHHDHGATIVNDQVLELEGLQVQTGKILVFPEAGDGFAD